MKKIENMRNVMTMIQLCNRAVILIPYNNHCQLKKETHSITFKLINDGYVDNIKKKEFYGGNTFDYQI